MKPNPAFIYLIASNPPYYSVISTGFLAKVLILCENAAALPHPNILLSLVIATV